MGGHSDPGGKGQRRAAAPARAKPGCAAIGTPMYLRNARFISHSIIPAIAALWLLTAQGVAVGLGFLLLYTVIDAVLTDQIWPRLADRYGSLHRLTRVHLRVVDVRTGQAPSAACSGLRGLTRLVLCLFELSRAVRRRREPGLVLHDRLTRTTVMRLR